MYDVPNLLRNLALSLIPFILSLSVHEFAHAWTAHALGDETAREQGRLTLNPVAHIDPFGTLLLPILGALSQTTGLIAWAKPVPYDPRRFRDGINRRVATALVAAAGPLSNLVLALVCVLAMAGLMRLGVPMLTSDDHWASDPPRPTATCVFLHAMWTRNVALALFNLIPVPPLDGHRLLPPIFDRVMVPLARYGFALLMVIFFFFGGVADFLFYRPMAIVFAVIRTTFGVY